MAKKRPTRAHWSRAIGRLMAAHPSLRTQTALAQASGVAQSTVGRILRGTVDPQSDNVEQLARAFGLTYSALAALAEADESGGGSAQGRRAVPLLGWVPGPGSAIALSEDSPAHVLDWIGCPRQPRGARTVAGDSMAPEYAPGQLIYVDPDVPAVDGKDVIVCRSDSPEVEFKRLVVKRTCRYLRALNRLRSQELLPLVEEARIWGVVVGMYSDR